MTALCGGGTSAPKLGTDLISQFTTARLTQLAVLRGLSWTSPWLALISLAPIAVTAFCGSDPPTISTLTTTEIDALVNLTFGTDLTSGLAKIKDMILNAIWEDICECTSGTLTPPTYPPPVTGTPIPQLPVSPSGTCDVWDDVRTMASSGTSQFVIRPSIYGKNPTYGKLTVGVTGMTGASATVTVSLNAYQVGTGTLSGIALNTHLIAANGTTTTSDGYIRADTEHIALEVHVAGSTTSPTITSHAEIYCGDNRPGGTITPCCPPDESTQNQLELILKMVTLIQRQNAPFAYVSSTAHSGLSGTGSIAIQGLIGAKVDITTLPSWYGSEGTGPTQYFDLGFLTFGTPDGWPSSYRLDHDPTLMFPSRCALYTQLDYDLSPGVVVTITELLREP